MTPYKLSNIPFGKFYVNGNYVDGFPNITTDNSQGVFFNQGTADDKKNYLVAKEFFSEVVTTQTAEESYQLVLKSVGATLPKRDTLDERIINDVKNRTGRLIDVQGGYPHGTAYELTINAWPVLKSVPAPRDSDADGMADDWEKKNGLNPNDATDASLYKLSKEYTNIEVYINSLAPSR
jgi:hypothetical protein